MADPQHRRVVLPDLAATERLARLLAPILIAGDVVTLGGDLGAGKTSLARALIRSRLGRADEEVPSPTFTLVQTYPAAGDDAEDAPPVWHFDLYRLTGPEEVLELGWDEAVGRGIALVEWPDRLGYLLPGCRLDLVLEPGAAPDARIATLTGHGAWADRLTRLDLMGPS